MILFVQMAVPSDLDPDAKVVRVSPAGVLLKMGASMVRLAESGILLEKGGSCIFISDAGIAMNGPMVEFDTVEQTVTTVRQNVK